VSPPHNGFCGLRGAGLRSALETERQNAVAATRSQAALATRAVCLKCTYSRVHRPALNVKINGAPSLHVEWHHAFSA